MVAMTGRGAATIAAVVALALGVLGLAGVVPGLSLAGCATGPNCAVVPAGIYPAFAVTSTTGSLTVTLTDLSHVVGYASSRITVLWGDGAVSQGQVGSSSTHAYSGTGAYNVTDLVTAYPCASGTRGCPSPPATGALSRLVTVSATGAKCVTNCSKSPSPSVLPAFVWSGQGLTVVFTDQSRVTNANVTGISWSFGDGTGGASRTLGSSTTHVYGSAGVFLVSESVTASANGTSTYPSVVGSASQNVTIASCGSSCVNNTGSSGGPSGSAVPPAAASPIGWGLASAGAAMVALLVLRRELPGIGVIAVGALVGVAFYVVLLVV